MQNNPVVTSRKEIFITASVSANFSVSGTLTIEKSTKEQSIITENVFSKLKTEFPDQFKDLDKVLFKFSKLSDDVFYREIDAKYLNIVYSIVLIQLPIHKYRFNSWINVFYPLLDKKPYEYKEILDQECCSIIKTSFKSFRWLAKLILYLKSGGLLNLLKLLF